VAGTWVGAGRDGVRTGQVQHPSCCPLPGGSHQMQSFILVWGWLFFFPPPPFFFCLHFLFPVRVLLGECNEIKNRQNSAFLCKGVLGSLRPSQLPLAPKGTTRLLGLQVGDVSLLCPHPGVAGEPGTHHGRRWPTGTAGTHGVGVKTGKLEDVAGLWDPTWGYPYA